jgi:preprotein translocase subunit SecD
MRQRLTLSLIGILLVSFGGLIAVLATDSHPALGLDLQGGISVTQQPIGDYDPASLDLAVERIRERVDALGVSEPEILRQGDAIVVNLPGVKNQQEAIDLVKVTGQVYLRPVQQCIGEGVTTDTSTSTTTGDTGTGDTTAATTADSTADTAAPGPSRRVASTPPNSTDPTSTDTATTDTATTDTATTDTATSDTATSDTATSDTATGDTVTADSTDAAPLSTAVVSDPTQQQVLPIRGGGQCLVGPAGGTGSVFQNDASAGIISGGWGVTVSLRGGASGQNIWDSLATACFNGDSTCPSRRLAIELDGEIVSAPSVNTPTFDTGNVQITGSFSEGEAKNLARVLKSGSLPVRMQTQSVSNVSPTLGKDSLHAAIIAGLIGVGLVLLFLLLYYRHLGLVVVLGVIVSGSLLYGVISLLSKTQGLALSLSGIAGIIVSVGVTVDSYVVFFERLKDEVRSGRTLRNSAQRGFMGAWHTILIADVVSLIGALTLWYLTVGSVRNFAFFLGLSTLADLVVAWFFTRPAVLLLARTGWMARRKVMGIAVASSTPVAAGSAS